jgi:hypothetical protein
MPPSANRERVRAAGHALEGELGAVGGWIKFFPDNANQPDVTLWKAAIYAN